MNYTPTGFSGQSNPQPILKPCPFCGNKVELKHYKVYDNDWWYIVCKFCDIAVDPRAWNSNRSKEDAINKWNMRV